MAEMAQVASLMVWGRSLSTLLASSSATVVISFIGLSQWFSTLVLHRVTRQLKANQALNYMGRRLKSWTCVYWGVPHVIVSTAEDESVSVSIAEFLEGQLFQLSQQDPLGLVCRWPSR